MILFFVCVLFSDKDMNKTKETVKIFNIFDIFNKWQVDAECRNRSYDPLINSEACHWGGLRHDCWKHTACMEFRLLY